MIDMGLSLKQLESAEEGTLIEAYQKVRVVLIKKAHNPSHPDQIGWVCEIGGQKLFLNLTTGLCHPLSGEDYKAILLAIAEQESVSRQRSEEEALTLIKVLQKGNKK
jgi:hypothetical protein